MSKFRYWKVRTQVAQDRATGFVLSFTHDGSGTPILAITARNGRSVRLGFPDGVLAGRSSVDVVNRRAATRRRRAVAPPTARHP